MPMRGAITPGANIAQAVSICSAVMAMRAGRILGVCGTDFESDGAGDSIRFSGGADGRGHFGSRGRCRTRATGAGHAGRYLALEGVRKMIASGKLAANGALDHALAQGEGA